MAKRLRLRGTIWFATLYVDGARKECSTGCTDEAAARAVLATWERDAADPDRAAQKATLNDALNRLLIDREARVRSGDCTEATVKFYRRLAGHLVRVLGHDFPLARIKNSAVVSEYVDRRRLESVKDIAIKKEVALLVAALKRAKESGLWNGDVGAVVPSSFRPEYRPKKRDLTREEFLKLVPHLLPDSAAAAAFILATSAEDAVLRTVLRVDVPDDGAAQPRVPIRGTKAEGRDRIVPVVSDEQWVLLRFARKHGRGKGERLFGPLTNFRRDLREAAKLAKVPHVWPHSLRKAAGQFLIDLSVPLEIVSRVLGHADTRITERVYARVRAEDIGDRMLDAIDPRYARRAHRNRKKPRSVPTITKVPEPKAGPTVYTLAGVARTLDQWAKAHAIPKGTLYSRVVERGMTMAEALKLGSRSAATSARACQSSNDCRTYAADRSERDGLNGQDRDGAATPTTKKAGKKPALAVPRDGIEPPTRGFSILCSTN